MIAIDGLPDGGGLVLGDVAGIILAVFPALKLEVGAIGALAHDGELAPFHALDFSDLFDQPCGRKRVHGRNIYDYRYSVTTNFGPFSIFEEFRHAPP